MDDDYTALDTSGLIAHLRLEAGRIMEDTSCELVLALNKDDDAIDARLLLSREAAEDILALIAAAQALHRRQLVED